MFVLLVAPLCLFLLMRACFPTVVEMFSYVVQICAGAYLLLVRHDGRVDQPGLDACR